MWEFPSRLRALRSARHLSQEALALAIGVHPSLVSYWENGNKNPSSKNLLALAGVLQVSLNELTGLPDEAVFVGEQVEVPILGQIPAGRLQFTEETIVGYRWERAERVAGGVHFYLRVKGNCMYPRFHDGDLALVRVQPTIENGEIAVVVVSDPSGEDQATLKRVFVRGNQLVLRADNPAALDNPQLDPILADLSKARIIGKVVGGAWDG